MKILISDKTHSVCAQKFAEAGFEVDEKPGLSPEELLGIIGQYNGLVVRSAHQGHAPTAGSGRQPQGDRPGRSRRPGQRGHPGGHGQGRGGHEHSGAELQRRRRTGSDHDLRPVTALVPGLRIAQGLPLGKEIPPGPRSHGQDPGRGRIRGHRPPGGRTGARRQDARPGLRPVPERGPDPGTGGPNRSLSTNCWPRPIS